METAEEWAVYFNTRVLTEEEYPQRWDKMDHRASRGARPLPLNEELLHTHIEAYLEKQRGTGVGILGILPPYTGPDDDAPPPDSPAQRQGEEREGRGQGGVIHPLYWPTVWQQWEEHCRRRRGVRLVLVDPDPDPKMDDLAAVKFTPEVAIAQAKEYPGFLLDRRRLATPTLDVKAALMTAREAHELIDHGTPPGPVGTVPGRLVTVVVAHGLFEGATPATFVRRGHFTLSPPQVNELWLYWLYDSRLFRVFDLGNYWQGRFWQGTKTTEILLPEPPEPVAQDTWHAPSSGSFYRGPTREENVTITTDEVLAALETAQGISVSCTEEILKLWYSNGIRITIPLENLPWLQQATQRERNMWAPFEGQVIGWMALQKKITRRELIELASLIEGLEDQDPQVAALQRAALQGLRRARVAAEEKKRNRAEI